MATFRSLKQYCFPPTQNNDSAIVEWDGISFPGYEVGILRLDPVSGCNKQRATLFIMVRSVCEYLYNFNIGGQRAYNI